MPPAHTGPFGTLPSAGDQPCGSCREQKRRYAAQNGHQGSECVPAAVCKQRQRQEAGNGAEHGSGHDGGRAQKYAAGPFPDRYSERGGADDKHEERSHNVQQQDDEYHRATVSGVIVYASICSVCVDRPPMPERTCHQAGELWGAPAGHECPGGGGGRSRPPRPRRTSAVPFRGADPSRVTPLCWCRRWRTAPSGTRGRPCRYAPARYAAGTCAGRPGRPHTGTAPRRRRRSSPAPCRSC